MLKAGEGLRGAGDRVLDWRGSVLVSCGTALGTEWLLEASAAKGVPSWFKGVNTLLCSPPGAVLVAVPL